MQEGMGMCVWYLLRDYAGLDDDDKRKDLRRKQYWPPRRHLMSETPGSLSSLTFQLCLVRRKRSVPHLFNLCTLVLFWQPMFAAKLQAAVWAFSDQVDCCIFALAVGSCAVLAALLGAASESKDQVLK